MSCLTTGLRWWLFKTNQKYFSMKSVLLYVSPSKVEVPFKTGPSLFCVRSADNEILGLDIEKSTDTYKFQFSFAHLKITTFYYQPCQNPPQVLLRRGSHSRLMFCAPLIFSRAFDCVCVCVWCCVNRRIWGGQVWFLPLSALPPNWWMTVSVIITTAIGLLSFLSTFYVWSTFETHCKTLPHLSPNKT